MITPVGGRGQGLESRLGGVLGSQEVPGRVSGVLPLAPWRPAGLDATMGDMVVAVLSIDPDEVLGNEVLGNEVVGNIVSGSVVALVVAAIAWLGTDRFARRQEAARARRDRSLAAAEELYAVYGGFFAAWKEWEFARGRDRGERDRVPADLRQELLGQAADVEGRYESLVVRTALEHRLDQADRTVLWALRFGLKELRTAIREDAPLGWWRTDDPATPEHHLGARKYVAFKTLTARVAALLVDADPRDSRPAAEERAEALAAITATLSPEVPEGAPDATSDRLRGEQWHRSVPG